LINCSFRKDLWSLNEIISFTINSHRLLIEFVKYINYSKTHILCSGVNNVKTIIASPMTTYLFFKAGSPSKIFPRSHDSINHLVRTTMIFSLLTVPKSMNLISFSIIVFIRIIIFRKLENKVLKMIHCSILKMEGAFIKITKKRKIVNRIYVRLFLRGILYYSRKNHKVQSSKNTSLWIEGLKFYKY